jgi:hypothetical protein
MCHKTIQSSVLALTILGCVGLYFFFNTRELGFCDPACGSYVEEYQNIFLFFAVLLPNILLTYISSTSFQYWWRFAKYAIPVCFALIVAINFGVLHTGTTGSFGLGDMINQTYDLWSLSLIYIVFTAGSLIQILRGYRAGKRGVAV